MFLAFHKVLDFKRKFLGNVTEIKAVTTYECVQCGFVSELLYSLFCYIKHLSTIYKAFITITFILVLIYYNDFVKNANKY